MRGAPRKAYYKVSAGEWVQPIRDGYRMSCCDCGLVHILEFRTLPFRGGRKIQFRAWRDERATAAMRRRKG